MTDSTELSDDEEFAGLVREAEAGFDPDSLHRRRGRPSIGIGETRSLSVRLSPATRTIVEAFAEQDASSVSAIIRVAVDHYIVDRIGFLDSASRDTELVRKFVASIPVAGAAWSVYRELAVSVGAAAESVIESTQVAGFTPKGRSLQPVAVAVARLRCAA